jgi:8-oxo-dGTP pyrophosphatase MutT (NUDIX family)
VIKQLKKYLAQRQKISITNPSRTKAAVLIPIYQKDGQYHIIFIQRTDKVRAHKNQISFPGGAYEKADEILEHTALRESMEEIGLNPADVEILGELDDLETTITGYIISPFVGLIPYPYEFKTDDFETEEIIDVPLSVLLDQRDCDDEPVYINGIMIPEYTYRHGSKVIWGATARILHQLLGIISDVISENNRHLETI